MKRCSIVLVSFILAVAPLLALAAPRLIDRSMVTVNGDVVLESDIDTFLHKMKSKSFQDLFGAVDPKALKDREGVLQLLIEEKIINQQVKKLDLQASDQEVEGQIRAIVKRNNISESQLGERLHQLGTSMEDYREGIRRQIERRNLIEREIKPSLEISDEQLRHFYLRNSHSEEAEPQFHIAHILIENKARGGLSAPERAQKVYEEVQKQPSDFERLAKESSDDTDTAGSGGVLGFYSASSLAKEFRDAVPKTQPGQVTAPIKTGVGYHIVKVLEVRRGDFSTLSKERKEALRNQLMGSELEKKMTMWIERKKMEAHIQRFEGKNGGVTP